MAAHATDMINSSSLYLTVITFFKLTLKVLLYVLPVYLPTHFYNHTQQLKLQK